MNGPVLLLDDDPGILDVLRIHLTEHDYECVAETSPKRALSHLEKRRFTLLITDLSMPEMPGIDVVRKSKESDPDLAIIVVTGLSEVSHAVEAIRVGADDYILKPFNLSEIDLAAERALDKRRLVIENRLYQEDLETRVNEATSNLESTNEELARTKHYLESLIHSTIDIFISTDASNTIEFVNEGAERTLGYAVSELMGRSIAELYQGGREEVSYLRRKLRGAPVLPNYETELHRKDGTTIPVNVTLSTVREEGKLRSVLAVAKDITEQKRLELELKEMSIKDNLTELFNQRHFYDRLEAEIERARRQRHPLSLLLFDIDGFKQYNDGRGHLEGDHVLSSVGAVVRECTREHVDFGFRYGGDEFTVILPEADETQAHIIAERIRGTFEAKAFDSLTLSIGLMTYEPDLSLKGLIQGADAMMYEAKRAGGNRVSVHPGKKKATK